MSNIIIDEDIVDEILSAIGSPLLTIEDTELETLDNFKKFIIKPSLRMYFKHFPIIYSQDYNISGSDFNIEAPAEVVNIFNANAKLNTSANSVPINSGNIFYRSQYTRTSQKSAYIGSDYDYGLSTANMYRQVENQSFVNTNQAFRYDFDRATKRHIRGYSNTGGKIEVQWMCFSNDSNMIAYERLDDFVMYCQGTLLIQLAMIRGQLNANQGNSEWNNDLFITQGNDLKNKAIEHYTNVISNPVVIRL